MCVLPTIGSIHTCTYYDKSSCSAPRLATVQDSDQSEEDLAGLIPDRRQQQEGATSLAKLQEQQREYEEHVRRLEAEIKLLEDEIERRDHPPDPATDKELERAM